MTETDTNSGFDLLYGVPRIAAFLGISVKATYHLVERGRIPSFKIGKTVCARRTTLAAKITELEAAAGDDSEAA